MKQGEVWWAELPDPRGSEPGYRCPVVIVQGDAFNRSRISTILCVPLTSNLRLGDAPGNVFVGSTDSGLPKDSIANVSQVITLDKNYLVEVVGELPPFLMNAIIDGVMLVLGR